MSRTDAADLVLIVDDDADNREILQMSLEAEGYSVMTAEGGAAALARLREGARPALILLDVMMPVMSGWQVCEECAKDPALASIPVVIVSALPQRAPPPYASVVDYITKPIDLQDLFTVVARHCRS